MSRSTLFPVLGDRSKLKRLAEKSQLVPVAATLAAAVGLFFVNDWHVFVWIVGSLLSFGFMYFVYQLCGRDRPWWLLGAVCLATMAALGFGDQKVFGLGLYSLIYPIFRGLGSDLLARSSNPILQLWGALCVGLSEELFKALPVLGLALIGRRLRNPFAQRVAVLEPLDGILMGVASGVGFTLIETLTNYVPRVAASSGAAAGLAVLLPRLLTELGGHLAYSGYFGYFIGLSVLKPRQAPRLLLFGWASAAVLHGAWDGAASIFGESLSGIASLFVIAVVSYGCLAAAILKARELSPTRAQNFASVISRVGVPPAPAGRTADLDRVGRIDSSRSDGRVRSAPLLVLTIGTVRHPVSSGVLIHPEELGSAGAGRGKGPIAEVITNPNDTTILGLRNVSTIPWRAALPTGQSVVVDGGRTVRLDLGTRIDFGGIEGLVQSASC